MYSDNERSKYVCEYNRTLRGLWIDSKHFLLERDKFQARRLECVRLRSVLTLSYSGRLYYVTSILCNIYSRIQFS